MRGVAGHEAGRPQRRRLKAAGGRRVASACPAETLTRAVHMLTIYVDADACPVKDEVYRVARRYTMRVAVVANASLRVPADELIELVV